MKKVIVGKSKGLADAEQCDIHVVMLSFWYSTVKWLVLKPLVKLHFIINGKVIGDIKWYQRHFTQPVRWQWLNKVTYKLTKYTMFK
jgi:hypothetical protein